MVVSDEVKTWIAENLKYNKHEGSLTWCADGSSAVEVRRKRMKVRVKSSPLESRWLDAASVCLFLRDGEWPEFGVLICSPLQCKDSILQDWNLKKRSRADFMKNEAVIVTRELLQIVLDCVRARLIHVTQNASDEDDIAKMLMDEIEVINELERVLGTWKVMKK